MGEESRTCRRSNSRYPCRCPQCSQSSDVAERDLSPARLDKKSVKAAKIEAAQKVLDSYPHKILNIRSHKPSGAYAEYLVRFIGVGRRRNAVRPKWIEERKVPEDVRAAYITVRDQKDDYDGYAKQKSETEKKCLKKKAKCNARHCRQIAKALGLNSTQGDLNEPHHVTLIHPGEGCRTSWDMVNLGISPTHIHQPNRDAFAKCCGQGFPNIYPSLLGDLPQYVQDLVFCSLFADFCGCCGGQLEELEDSFKSLNKTKYFVLSVTLCSCRHGKFRCGPYRDQTTLVPKLIEDMALSYGYVFHERPLYDHYKVERKMKMHNWTFLLRCDYPCLLKSSFPLDSESDDSSLPRTSDDDSDDDSECNSLGLPLVLQDGILLPPVYFPDASADSTWRPKRQTGPKVPLWEQSTSYESESESIAIPKRNLTIVLS